MSRMKLEEMTTERLVDLFVRIALDQDKAVRRDDNSTFNRLYKQMDAVQEEMKRRPGDQSGR